MVQTAIELRGIQVKAGPRGHPGRLRPGVRGRDGAQAGHLRRGGRGGEDAWPSSCCACGPRTQVEDGKITVIGKDVDDLPDGSKTPLAIIVDVYGKKMQEDFESVLERRIHQFVNFAEGAWHTGQRNTIWVRLSKSSVRAGFRFKHFGDILVTKLKEEFGNIVSRVQVTIITDEAKAKRASARRDGEVPPEGRSAWPV